jgi:hypothetical protein
MASTGLAKWLLLPSGAGAEPPTPTAAYLAVNLAGGALFAVIGGFVTAFLSQRAPMAHVLALAVAIVALFGVSIAMPEPGQPPWYPYVLVVLGPGGVLLGGWLRARKRPTQSVAK